MQGARDAAQSGGAVDFDRTTLPSGIEVVSETMPQVRSAAIGFWVRVGSRDEEGADRGASHFLEHLLFKGTERRSAREIAEAIDEVGGDLNAFTSKEYTCFHARVIDRDLPVAADVLADMMSNATITEADVDQERQVVLEEINIHYDTPEELVHTDFAALLLRDHPLAREILGDAETIRTMTRDRIRAYYERYYRPANLTVAVAGNVAHDEVVDLIEELTRSGGDQPERRPPDGFAEGQVAIRNRPTEQAHVVLGVPGLARDDERRFTLLVLNEILGGGMSSRLFQEIREQRGLAYSTYSYHAAHADAGWFGCYAGTSPARVDELLKVVGDELNRLASSIDEHELARAKGGVRGSVVLGLEDTGSRMSRLGKMVCTGAEPLTIDEALTRIEAVDLDAVRTLATELFERPRCLAVVGPFTEDDVDRFHGHLSTVR